MCKDGEVPIIEATGASIDAPNDTIAGQSLTVVNGAIQVDDRVFSTTRAISAEFVDELSAAKPPCLGVGDGAPVSVVDALYNAAAAALKGVLEDIGDDGTVEYGFVINKSLPVGKDWVPVVNTYAVHFTRDKEVIWLESGGTYRPISWYVEV